MARGIPSRVPDSEKTKRTHHGYPHLDSCLDFSTSDNAYDVSSASAPFVVSYTKNKNQFFYIFVRKTALPASAGVWGLRLGLGLCGRRTSSVRVRVRVWVRVGVCVKVWVRVEG